MEVHDAAAAFGSDKDVVETDLFNWQTVIGNFREEYDAEARETVTVFRRTPDIQLAIKRVNKYLFEDRSNPQQLVRRLLGKWRTAQSKLIPFIEEYWNDETEVDTLSAAIRTLVHLTEKIPKETRVADRLALHTQMLRLKADIVRSPTLLRILLGRLRDPIRLGPDRQRHHMAQIEYVLYLLSNLLGVRASPDPDTAASAARGGVAAGMSAIADDAAVSDEFLVALHSCRFPTIAIGLCQVLDSSENVPLTKHLLRFFSLLAITYDPADVVRSHARQQKAGPAVSAVGDVPTGSLPPFSASSGRRPITSVQLRPEDDPLVQMRRQGRLGGSRARPPTRHPRFGSTFARHAITAPLDEEDDDDGSKKKGGGRAGRLEVFSNPAAPASEQVYARGRRRSGNRGGKKTARMAGAGANEKLMAETMQAARMAGSGSIMSERAKEAVFAIYRQLLETNAFAQLTRSCQKSLVRGGEDLGESASMSFLALVAFVLGFRRLAEMDRLHPRNHSHSSAPSSPSASASPTERAPFTPAGAQAAMDMFTVHFVVREAGDAQTRKDLEGLAAALHTLKEILLMLLSVRGSDDPDAQLIGRSMTNTIFYEREIVDLVPRLLRTWEPGRFTTQYLHDLIEAAHALLKVAQEQAESGTRVLRKTRRGGAKKRKGSEQGDGDEEEDEEMLAEREAQRKQEAGRKEESFDFHRYLNEFLYQKTMRAYAEAMHSYSTNSARMNHYIGHFLLRVVDAPLPSLGHAGPDTLAASLPEDDPLLAFPRTWEPWLWHISFLRVFQRIMRDPVAWDVWRTHGKTSRRPRTAFATLVQLASRVLRGFFRAARVSPLVLVEALFLKDRQTVSSLACGYELTEVQRASGGKAGAGGGPLSKTQAAQLEAEREAAINAQLMAEEEDEGDAEWDPDGPVGVDGQGASDAGSLSSSSSESAAGGDSEDEQQQEGEEEDERVLDSGAVWTAEEDDTLKRLYPEMKSYASCFDVIASDDVLSRAERSAAQVRARAVELGLLPPTAKKQGDGEAEKKKKKKKRGRKEGRTDRARPKNGKKKKRDTGKGRRSLHRRSGPSSTSRAAEEKVYEAAMQLLRAGLEEEPTEVSSRRRGGRAWPGAARCVTWLRTQACASIIAIRRQQAAAKRWAEGWQSDLPGVPSRSVTNRVASFPLIPRSDEESSWLMEEAVIALCLTCGMRKPVLENGEVWWRIDGSEDARVASALGLERALLDMKEDDVDEEHEEASKETATPSRPPVAKSRVIDDEDDAEEEEANRRNALEEESKNVDDHGAMAADRGKSSTPQKRPRDEERASSDGIMQEDTPPSKRPHVTVMEDDLLDEDTDH